jgi:hypothetical protein
LQAAGYTAACSGRQTDFFFIHYHAVNFYFRRDQPPHVALSAQLTLWSACTRSKLLRLLIFHHLHSLVSFFG